MKILAVFILVTFGMVLSLDLGSGGVYTTKQCKDSLNKQFGSEFFAKLAQAQKNIDKEATQNKNDKNKPTRKPASFAGPSQTKDVGYAYVYGVYAHQPFVRYLLPIHY